jgi:phage terminase large subunit GpA-like protein
MRRAASSPRFARYLRLPVGQLMAEAVTEAMALWAPPPRLRLSEWADQHRRLSPESSGEPGRWNTDRAAYQRGMMDALTDPLIERVVLMTSARVGKTQCLNNLVGYHIHQDPAPIMLVLPSIERAEEWADDEFDPMVRDTPPLRAILGERKSRDSEAAEAAQDLPRRPALHGGCECAVRAGSQNNPRGHPG